MNIDEENSFSIIETSDDGIGLIPEANSGFYSDPAGEKTLDNAVFMYVDIEGDFAARALLDQDFLYTGDAAALMVYDSPSHWASVAFEKSLHGTKSITACVTENGISDKSAGPDYSWEAVWLHIARKGNNFAVYFSPDGIHKHLARLFRFDCGESLRLGLAAQSPNGNGDATMNFYSFEVEKFTVKDLREGN